MSSISGRRGIRALVPVKRFTLAKSRLAAALPPAARRRLAQAMLGDVLATLAAVPELAGVMVITAEPQAAALAAALGAEVLAEPAEGGLNPALARGLAALAADGQAGALIVPADIPLLGVAEVRAVLAALEESQAVMAPARRDGGTNLLALRPPGLLAPAFGPDSFSRHLAAARAAGVVPRLLPLAGASHDIDVPADLCLAGDAGSAVHTRRALAAILPTGSPPAADAAAGPGPRFTEVSLS